MTSLATVADVLTAAAKLYDPHVVVDTTNGSLRSRFILSQGTNLGTGQPENNGELSRATFNELRRNAYVDTHIDKVLLSGHHRAYPVRMPDGQAIQAPEEDGA